MLSMIQKSGAHAFWKISSRGTLRDALEISLMKIWLLAQEKTKDPPVLFEQL